MKQYIKYTLADMDEWFWLNRFRVYRAIRAGGGIGRRMYRRESQL
jgi:hypothetical protein